MTGHPGAASLDEVLTAVFAYGPATNTDLLTGAVAARAGSSVYAALLRLPDGIYREHGDVALSSAAAHERGA